MAFDEALLETAASATLRCYRWDRPTVSLGYFQEHDAVRGALAAAVTDVPPLVRRITGGGAIWHEHEITYCLIGDCGSHGFPASTRELYPLVHGAVLAELLQRGARLSQQETSVGDRRYQIEPRCFASPAAQDLTAPSGAKVLGSAARQRGGRVLLHGSLKLASNAWDGQATAGCGLEPEAAIDALIAGCARALALDPAADEPTASEAEACARILEARYATDAWVTRREGPRP